MKQIIKKIKITANIEVLTGLHIGGSNDSVEIGGIDIAVIKLATKNNQPYIPGSSLRGKMRCLLEQVDGAIKVGLSDRVNKLFGITEKKIKREKTEEIIVIKAIASRLIVRDAMLTCESEQALKNAGMALVYTECKTENAIDRISGTAKDPRQIERVPAGAVFAAEFVINVWDGDDENALIKTLQEGIALLENDYLGGNGSRGYGQIKFGKLNIKEYNKENGWGTK